MRGLAALLRPSKARAFCALSLRTSQEASSFVMLYDVRSLALPTRSQLKQYISWVSIHREALDVHLQVLVRVCLVWRGRRPSGGRRSSAESLCLSVHKTKPHFVAAAWMAHSLHLRTP